MQQMNSAQSRLLNRVLMQKHSMSPDIYLSPASYSDEEDSVLDADWLQRSRRGSEIKEAYRGDSPLSACFLDNFTSDDLSLGFPAQSDKCSSKSRVLKLEDTYDELELRAACSQAVSLCAFDEWDVERTLAGCRYKFGRLAANRIPPVLLSFVFPGPL
jgi:hypothetical protein